MLQIRNNYLIHFKEKLVPVTELKLEVCLELTLVTKLELKLGLETEL